MLEKTLMELNNREIIYKKMYLNHPELHLDSYRIREDVDALTQDLPEYQQLFQENPDYFSNANGSSFNEQIIPQEQDVSILIHERYLPSCIHTHDFFEMTYIFQGQGVNYVSGNELIQKKGDLCIMAPNTPHAVQVFSDDTIMFNILIRFSTFQRVFFGTLINMDILSSFFSKALYSSNSDSFLFFETGEDTEIRDLILKLYLESANQRPYTEHMLNALVTTIFVMLLRSHQQHLTVPNPSGNKSDKDIMFILNYMISNYKDLSLGDLASFFNYSERQMGRILRDYTGKSFRTIIQDIRLQHACEFLRNPHIPIVDVMDAVGYTNATNFYTVFKRRYQVTPAKWREDYLVSHM